VGDWTIDAIGVKLKETSICFLWKKRDREERKNLTNVKIRYSFAGRKLLISCHLSFQIISQCELYLMIVPLGKGN
jgi:hypothetical protein